jgi:PBSX family phage terminase large subunit
MILTPSQSIIATDLHRFRVVNCGRRFGKTTLAVLEMIAKAVYGNNRQVCYIAPTYQQARDIAWQELKKLARPAINKVNESRLEIILNTTNGGTSSIMLRGWESIETLRGQKFDFIVVDEIASMRNWDINWEEVIRPTLTDVKGDVLFISTPKGFNHFYDLFNKESKDTDYKSFHFTSYDNPHLPVEELNKAKTELTEDRFAQEYMADFRKTEGLVYKEFDRSRHVVGTLPEHFDEVIAGIDFGFTNPTAVIHIGRTGDDNYIATQEWYKTGRTEEQIADYVQSCNFNRVYPDSEAPSAIEVLNRRGIAVVEVVKNKDSIQNGINRVRQLLKMGKLHVHSSCVNLITEFETYAYPAKKPDHNEYENPIKENDHALDALRYALSTNANDTLQTAEHRARNYFEAKRNLTSSAR